MVGVPYAEHGQKDEGVALVFYGSKKGLKRKPAWTFDGDRANGHLGESVMSAGDLNGDGVPDLLLAGVDMEDPNNPRTRVVAVYGSRGGLTNSSNHRIDKPVLAMVQQSFDAASNGTVWLGMTALIGSGVMGLLFIQARLRRRIAVLVEQNRNLVLAEERARLARDIHDHLGADLTQLAVQLEQARERADSPAQGQRLRGLSAFAGNMLDTVRELVWATAPERDTLDSTLSFVGEHIVAYLQPHGLQCELDFPLEVPVQAVSARFRHNLLLIVKEVMHNVVKHAHATRLDVQLRLNTTELKVQMVDNGCGFASHESDPESLREPDHHRGSGLDNLRERAASLGGSCRIDSAPGRGTTVTLILPLGVSKARSGRTKGP